MDAIKALHIEVKRLKEQNAHLRIENRRLEWYKIKYEVRERTLNDLQQKLWNLELAELKRKERI